MAQTKRKRKHRGNAAGIVERPAHNSRGTGAASQKARRPQSKEEMRAEARRKRVERLNRPPTWKGAIQRAAIAAALFVVLVIVFFGENVATALSIGVFMLVVYVPLSFLTDRAMYNWRQKKRK
jgi:hypothetical protein